MIEKKTNIDPDKAIESVIWKNQRKYRISITADDTYKGVSGRERLFKGYKEEVDGNNDRRQAETIHFKNIKVTLRPWMTSLAMKCYALIEEMESKRV